MSRSDPDKDKLIVDELHALLSVTRRAPWQWATHCQFNDSEGNLCFPGKYPYGLGLMIDTGGFEWLELKVA